MNPSMIHQLGFKELVCSFLNDVSNGYTVYIIHSLYFSYMYEDSSLKSTESVPIERCYINSSFDEKW